MSTQYEELRSSVLDANTAGGRFGLVILLREGVAAWMADPAVRPASAARSTNKEVSVNEHVVPTETHPDMIQILANMAMATYQEKCL